MYQGNYQTGISHSLHLTANEKFCSVGSGNSQGYASMPLYIFIRNFSFNRPYELYRAYLSYPLLESFVTRSPIWFNLENNYQEISE